MDAPAFFGHLDANGAAFAAATRDALDRIVVSCPGWTVADLVEHLGTVHVWVHQCLQIDPAERPPRWDSLPKPPGADELVDWYADAHRRMTDALAADHLDRQVATFMGPQTVAWWVRRQAHETAIHRWDAERATGEPTALATALAIDGVDELFELVLPRFGTELSGTGETIHLHATDDDSGAGEWLLTLGPDGTTVTKGHAKGDVAVRATASDLNLLLWGRRAIDDAEVFDDVALFSAWREKIAF